MSVDQKMLEMLEGLINPYLCATKCEPDEDIFLDGKIYNIPLALLEIAKGLNRIADEIGKK